MLRAAIWWLLDKPIAVSRLTVALGEQPLAANYEISRRFKAKGHVRRHGPLMSSAPNGRGQGTLETMSPHTT